MPTPRRSFVRAFGLKRFANRWANLFYDFHLHKQSLPDSPIDVEALSGACILVMRCRMLVCGMRGIPCIARTWTGACAFGRRAGRFCSCPMPASAMSRGRAASRAVCTLSGISTKGCCGFIASSSAASTPAC